MVIATVAWCGAAPADPPRDPVALGNAIAESRAIVLRELAPKVPGMAVAVSVDGKLVWSEGFGYKYLGTKTPVTSKTRFRIGSISKSLTSAGLALLVERGLVDLDAPIQTYVPDFPVKGAPITTRQLGGHLSGIRYYRGNETMLNKPFANVRAGLKIFENDPLDAPPGTKYVYSTYGWTLISAAMEGATGQDFLAYMDDAVIRPLGLMHTGADFKGVNDPDRAYFYRGDGPAHFAIAPTVDSSYKWAGGGYLSTPEDLVRFGSALLQPGFLQAKSLTLLFTSQKTADGKPTGYGFGWVIDKDRRGHPIYYHRGGSIGGTSVLLLHPSTKTVVAMACNHSTTPFQKESWEPIIELFAPLFTAR